jgi:rubrerythrin
MKRLDIIFWAALSLGAMAIVITAITVSRERYAPKHTQHYTALQRLGEIARIKFHHAQLHTSFAEQAQREERHQAARLFRAIAFSEDAQCRQCQEAIENLGGEFITPIALERDIASTQENILRATKLKDSHRTTKAYPMLLKSIASGNRYVTRILIWCDADDAHQITLLSTQQILTDSITAGYYYVCPKCGYITEGVLATPICPQCKTKERYFARF